MEYREVEIDVRVRIRTVRWDGPWDLYRRRHLASKPRSEEPATPSANPGITEPGDRTAIR